MFKQNLKTLERLLPALQENGVSHLINGKQVSSVTGESFENSSPVDGTSLGQVASGSAEEIDSAAQAAQAAFLEWRAVHHKNRRDLLHAIADEIEKRAEEIAVLESYDTGQPIRFMKKAAVRGAANFRFFADRIIDAQNGLSTPDTAHVNYTIRQPIGPVGIITPWNTPFMLSTWKIAPALAAGCTIVHKPAELSPITANRLAECAHAAGLPAGVWNVVHGFGETAGKALTEHEAIRAVAFIGETTTGSLIMKQGAPTLKRVHLELGGKNPVIVFDDADLDRALDAAIFMKYSLNGERCTSSSRLLLQQSVYDEFLARLTDRVSKIRVGHPLDPDTEVGPLIHTSHQEKVLSYAGIGQEEGARLMTGGTKVKGQEAHPYVTPTLMADADSSMRLAQEEIFGPFLTVIPFETEEEAIQKANSVKYGLTAYIWTRDVGRAHRVARAVESGMVWVNSQNVRHLPTPFGGVKYSGIGRDGGDYSFDFYMETKNISIALGDHPIPQLGIG